MCCAAGPLAGRRTGSTSTLAAAPARADEADTQQWTLFTFQKELSPKWRAYFEVQPRFGVDLTDGDTDHGVERLLVRPAIGYRLSSKLSIWQSNSPRTKR